jgi:hypothetical protein
MTDPYSQFLITSIYPHAHEYIKKHYPLEDMQQWILDDRQAEAAEDFQSLVCEMILRQMHNTDGMKETFFLQRVLTELAIKPVSQERFIDLTSEWMELRASLQDSSTMSRAAMSLTHGDVTI